MTRLIHETTETHMPKMRTSRLNGHRERDGNFAAGLHRTTEQHSTMV